MYTRILLVLALFLIYRVSAKSVGFTQFQQYGKDPHGNPSYFSYEYKQEVQSENGIYQNPNWNQGSSGWKPKKPEGPALLVKNGKLVDKEEIKNKIKIPTEGFLGQGKQEEEDLNVEDIQAIVDVVENIKNLREVLPIKKRRRNGLSLEKKKRRRFRFFRRNQE